MTVLTLGIVEKQPAALRGLIGKYLALPRWQDSCDFYNQMMERDRLSVCFHAQLKQRHAVMRFEEMNDVDRERLVCAIDELRAAFSKRRQVGASEIAYISYLTVSQRRTLFLHAGLTENEFNQPYWRINDDSCYWREKLFRALRELFSLFEYAPTILTSVKPEQYLH
ncbi:TPA: replication protein B [Klebsiella pneumoniae]|uniref:replication protein B n=1 Tax=Klebsiella quasipneumoniae TaxID=1463165 RepID=UPI001E465C7F|nr:replication protein B [Klebsiella quasipneumoniae]MCS5814891.1 replication protein B [Klebsiella pneumoniae subsp. pneumoniae]HBR7900288.1 replication protein B [Klebsiella pneumoniae]MCC5461590.1 replication protein B [Klebsiella quasipneumoniae subsp. similipneumoniae]HBV8871425.1 replication protein B [Klebsiella pneumoniae]HBW8811451.1 replication protein B [Klebsiella pneumoniae]